MKNAKRKLKKLAAKAKPFASAVVARFRANFHTALLVWLLIRVEGLHAKLDLITNFMVSAAITVVSSLFEAKMQFEGAIRSILSLFGGDGA